LETGTHDELLRDNRAYAHLVHSQKLKENTPSDDDAVWKRMKRGTTSQRTRAPT